MSHYQKLAFAAFRVVGLSVIVYSLISCVYLVVITRPFSIGAVVAALIPALFYLLLGVLLFAFSQRLAKLAVNGLDRE